MRPPLNTDGTLPPTLPMGTPDVAYHLALRGRPLPVVFAFRFGGPAPSLEAVRARVAERAHRIPALRYRVAPDRKVLLRVDRIAVEQHVHEAWLSEDDAGGAGAVRLLLSRPMNVGERPTWDVWLVHGPEGDHTLCYRTDHTLQDGVGAAHTARALLDDNPEGGPAAHHRSWPTPRGLAGAIGDVAASFRPTAKPAFDGTSSGRTTACHADTSLERLRAIGRAHGGTVNDVYLAALSHAVRTWHLKATGSPHPPLPVAVPMSVRAPGEECAPGNHMVVARLLLPCDETTPRQAFARVAARTTRLRASRQRDGLNLLLAATPRAIGARIGTRLVNGSVVAGPASSVNFGQALVHQGLAARRAVVLSGLASGIRVLTTLTGHHDVACLTVVHDESLATADELPDLWLAAVLELERA
ncbi:wax ester/triacylglycerol synthase domain-containing protein [Streptomyces sp. NPDC050619]|uniref:wax ester/triacylglycerol synthase domain-containing protein n=1 Tax=Streptomyces sp. NPDC050619 TaxID=3157214 RepID=UPI00341271B6